MLCTIQPACNKIVCQVVLLLAENGRRIGGGRKGTQAEDSRSLHNWQCTGELSTACSTYLMLSGPTYKATTWSPVSNIHNAQAKV